MNHEPNILITGANGQLGTVLTKELRKKFGTDRVLATDIRKEISSRDPYEFLDILNPVRFKEIIGDYKINQIYHLAAILSASGEWNPPKTWNVNFRGLMTVLDLCREMNIQKVFFPSSIAVFGLTTPRENTAQDVPLLPETVYGISKATGELWCNYYHKKYNLDVRSIRFPGIIGYQSLPSGGTTDYAVEIFHAALEHKTYECFLNADTRLPMLYMDDATRSIIQLMSAPSEDIQIRYSYNLAAMSFTPQELANEISKHIPGFKIVYKPDFRQEIADSWSESIDDSNARRDWKWNPQYDLSSMTIHMIENLRELKS